MRRCGRWLLVTIILSCLGACHKSQKPVVAILQDKPEQWANDLQRGFLDELAAHNLKDGRDFTLIERSATGDPQTLMTLASLLATGHYRVVYTLGTQASQLFLSDSRTAPFIFGAVTDPVAAGLYRGTLSNPAGNDTGTQDIWPYRAQFALFRRILPSLKRVGVIYNSSEINSQASMVFIRAEAARLGITLVVQTVTGDAEVEDAVASVLSKHVGAFYIPADNTAQSAAPVIIAACMSQRVPVFTGISDIVKEGALATVGTNYYELGKINGDQAIKVLLNGLEPRKIAVATSTTGDTYVNLTTAARLGIQIPQDVRQGAVALYR